ncbi:hypothetical protein BU23DRAFT_5813 [Bimuria novae-zelandiae CBS 107.79]|uniref:Uncharacterized protein n=1 Tax=Bimuria novae-zelandiae CBS 107.79 TaxID=1447943 RepID=A0A6A5VTQ8_9PLEO|nr:hypothetical protein BU23DRAFT_5813 [Bimuria novae-zelandiae CBS 107.79]
MPERTHVPKIHGDLLAVSGWGHAQLQFLSQLFLSQLLLSSPIASTELHHNPILNSLQRPYAMHPTLALSIVASSFALCTMASGPTKLYIDSVDEYDLLASCAEQQVSLVVRSMAYGCGDGSKLTSYACFCFQSSAYYSRMISTKVTSACSTTRGQGDSAVEVFSKYCQLGDVERVTTTGEIAPKVQSVSISQPITEADAPEPTVPTTSSQSTTASPANNPATRTAPPTGTPMPQAAERPTEKKTAAIAAGVAIPVVVIALGLMGIFIYLRRQKRTPPDELPAEQQTMEISGEQLVFEKDTYRHGHEKDRPHEMDANNQPPGELASTPWKQNRDRKIERLVSNESRL